MATAKQLPFLGHEYLREYKEGTRSLSLSMAVDSYIHLYGISLSLNGILQRDFIVGHVPGMQGEEAGLGVNLTCNLCANLRRHHSSLMQDVLKLAGKWVQSYIGALTGSVALGVEAAGIQVSLPGEVCALLAMLTEMGRFQCCLDALLSQYIPFVYDSWLSVLN